MEKELDFSDAILSANEFAYEMCGDNGIRNASRTLHLYIQHQDAKVKHCYKHQGSYMWLGPSVSNRLLAFATRRMLLCFLLIVTTKIKLIRRGEEVIFTKMSLQRVSTFTLLSFPVITT